MQVLGEGFGWESGCRNRHWAKNSCLERAQQRISLSPDLAMCRSPGFDGEMPELNWIGKQAVRAHHREVPFHLLKEVAELGCAGSEQPSMAESAGSQPNRRKGSRIEGSFGDQEENLIVQGDNLLALKALLPRYAGQVKCIYIDPPYNTGNEGWVYNDNVKAPEIQKWLKQVVGKESEDLSRHDKWLCMMYPRLQLLKRFLREDGAIFVSIDDNEVATLRLLMDEVFGATNFITVISWQKIYTVKNSARHFSEMHDYIMIYALNHQVWQPHLIPRSAKQDDAYKNPDNDERGPWKATPLHARNYYSQGLYAITSPSGRIIMGPPAGTYWRFAESTLLELIQSGQVWWGTDGNGIPSQKRFLSAVKQGVVPATMWFHDEAGHNGETKNELREILPNADEIFITPKPTRLIQRILQIATDRDSLVLDSFAGSGTTGHAVLKQNAEDGGTRRFILVEMDKKIASTITAERVRRVMAKGLGGVVPAIEAGESMDIVASAKPAPQNDLFDEAVKDSKSTTGKGKPKTKTKQASAQSPDGRTSVSLPGFRYATLGETLFDGEGNIRETVTFAQLAEFVWFQQTGAPLPPWSTGGRRASLESPLLGIHRGVAIYLLFNGILGDKKVNGGNVLIRPILYALPPHDGPKVIYAAACKISEHHLRRLNVEVKQIPYQLEVNAWL